MNPYLLAGAVIIVILSLTAAYYLFKLHKAQKVQAQAIIDGQQAWLAKQQEIAQDIRFIANAMLQEQCEITEGCLRIIPLMNRFHQELPFKADFSQLLQHQQACSEMPINEAYKALSRKEQFKLDKKRYELEAKNKDSILKEAKLLLNFRFDNALIH